MHIPVPLPASKFSETQFSRIPHFITNPRSTPNSYHFQPSFSAAIVAPSRLRRRHSSCSRRRHALLLSCAVAPHIRATVAPLARTAIAPLLPCRRRSFSLLPQSLLLLWSFSSLSYASSLSQSSPQEPGVFFSYCYRTSKFHCLVSLSELLFPQNLLNILQLDAYLDCCLMLVALLALFCFWYALAVTACYPSLLSFDSVKAAQSQEASVTTYYLLYLDENKSLILKIVESQSFGKLSECAE
ncbi:GRF1-interacting factor [Arachis hypogaea]|uniref:GRF1-interacting factor n=1 Tax=Arachis hypogaea TaxID=3818 RepID=A0A6B9V7A7_ARAHY|nr:GRF1-interacting factor [Arachis hypogaea]